MHTLMACFSTKRRRVQQRLAVPSSQVGVRAVCSDLQRGGGGLGRTGTGLVRQVMMIYSWSKKWRGWKRSLR